MNIDLKLAELRNQYAVIDVVNLNHWNGGFQEGRNWLEHTCRSLHKDPYSNNERIVFVHDADFYAEDTSAGIILRNLQVILNAVDISNFFVTVVSTNANIEQEWKVITELSQDSVPMTFHIVEGEFTKNVVEDYLVRNETYRYGSSDPINIRLDQLTARERFLLTESKTFCIYPWIHLHAYPTGEAYPCCHSEMDHSVGNCRNNTLEEIYRDKPMQELRDNMLNEIESPACQRCYEQEVSGFFSGRQSANKHHGQHIKRINDGKFQMSYWDIRFSNLCNLSCRSCGHIFSSSWYQDQVELAGPEWAAQNKPLNFAGKTRIDIWEQLIPHLDYVEQIYFAGGEPLMMEEHYNILDELERRGRFDVRLIYNTNFTHTKLKDRTVFDYWKRFKSVAVGASLDAMGPRAEYIRKGTNWDTVEHNRRQMLEICPEVDFYISPTLSILNAWHLPDFHRSWVEKGLLKPQDLNVNILQGPEFYRIDMAPPEYKQKLRIKFEQHLEWLRPLDPLQRATVGFESALNYMSSTDNTALLPKFRAKTAELDRIRKENILEVIPELQDVMGPYAP
jgi:radical SAM protein with 4Fe4S-binding SPASM domain